MTKYVYAAIICKEEDGYAVSFPDLPECHTCGESMAEAIEMAEDCLALALYDREEEGREIPIATDLECIIKNQGEIATLICCDTMEYRKMYDNKAIKKTLSIPNWLNTMSEKAGINFSQVLQEALLMKLDVK